MVENRLETILFIGQKEDFERLNSIFNLFFKKSEHIDDFDIKKIESISPNLIFLSVDRDMNPSILKDFLLDGDLKIFVFNKDGLDIELEDELKFFNKNFIFKDPIDVERFKKTIKYLFDIQNIVKLEPKDIELIYKLGADVAFGISIFSPDFGNLYVNHNFANIVSMDKKELIGAKNPIIKYDSSSDIHKRILTNLSENRGWRGKLNYTDKDKNRKFFNIAIVPYSKYLDINLFICFVVDITEVETKNRRKELMLLQKNANLISELQKDNVEDSKEIEALQKELQEDIDLIDELQKDKKQLEGRVKALNLRMAELSFLVNFEKIVSSEVERSRRYDESLSMIMLGIDSYKDIIKNIEDEFLIERMNSRFKNIIQSHLRVCDYVVKDKKREAYIILLPETDIGGAKTVVNKLKTLLSKMFKKFNNQLITVSFALTDLNKHSDTKDTILERLRDGFAEAYSDERGKVLIKDSSEKEES